MLLRGLCTDQVTKVAQRVSRQFHDALCEATVEADEAGDDVGQAVAGSVQHDRRGCSPHRDLRAL